MTNAEFSDSFDVLLNSYANQAMPEGQHSRLGALAFDEYEKSVYLTRAQEEVVVNLYNGKNSFGDSFESTEELRKYLEPLVYTAKYTSADMLPTSHSDDDNNLIIETLTDKSVLFKLPDRLAFIITEQITYDDESLGCYNKSTAAVYPITHDEYTKVIKNPFRGPTKYKALRLDAGNNMVELISKYEIGEYKLRYLKRPTPIILVDLPYGMNIDGENKATECSLNPLLHGAVLAKAVASALASRVSVTSK